MLPLIYAYHCVPRRFRFIVRWIAMCVVIVVLILVCILFYGIIVTLPEHRGGFLHPQSHQPGSPDFIAHRGHNRAALRRISED